MSLRHNKDVGAEILCLTISVMLNSKRPNFKILCVRLGGCNSCCDFVRLSADPLMTNNVTDAWGQNCKPAAAAASQDDSGSLVHVKENLKIKKKQLWPFLSFSVPPRSTNNIFPTTPHSHPLRTRIGQLCGGERGGRVWTSHTPTPLFLTQLFMLCEQPTSHVITYRCRSPSSLWQLALGSIFQTGRSEQFQILPTSGEAQAKCFVFSVI